MTSLLALLFVASLIFFIIGLFSPQSSLFWVKTKRTSKKSSLIFGGLIVLSFILFGALNKKDTYNPIGTPDGKDMTNAKQTEPTLDQTNTVLATDTGNVQPTDGNNTQSASEDNGTSYTATDQIIISKIKAKAKRDYPKDYYIQKAMYDQEVDAYFYMKTVTDREVEKKVQRDYPMDFYIQKAMYDQEIDAKEQMK